MQHDLIARACLIHLVARNATLPVRTKRRLRSASAHGRRAGMFVVGVVPPAATVTLAEALPPEPPSTEATEPVPLFCVPRELPVTFTLKVQEPLDASVALAKLMLPDPAVAVIVPLPQLPVRPFGVETTRPAGNVSVKATPVNAGEALGLLIVKLSEVDPFSGILAAPKDFTIVGGTTAPPTVTLAEAVPPVPPPNEVIAPVVLFFVPAVVPVTFTLKVHEALAASVAPVKLTAPDPAVATMVPAPQLPVSPFGVETTRPAGNVSAKPTPVNVVLGLLIVKLSEVDPFSTMLATPKDFTIVGAGAMTVPVVIRPIRSLAPSANHRLPSGPAVMPRSSPPAVMPALNSVTTPLGVIRPIQLPMSSVNHRLPSGPAVMPRGPAPAVMPALNSVTTPPVVIRPIRLPLNSVNHRLPSGPAVME